jgi:hypothetical protein
LSGTSQHSFLQWIASDVTKLGDALSDRGIKYLLLTKLKTGRLAANGDLSDKKINEIMRLPNLNAVIVACCVLDECGKVCVQGNEGYRRELNCKAVAQKLLISELSEGTFESAVISRYREDYINHIAEHFGPLSDRLKNKSVHTYLTLHEVGDVELAQKILNDYISQAPIQVAYLPDNAASEIIRISGPLTNNFPSLGEGEAAADTNYVILDRGIFIRKTKQIKLKCREFRLVKNKGRNNSNSTETIIPINNFTFFLQCSILDAMVQNRLTGGSFYPSYYTSGHRIFTY